VQYEHRIIQSGEACEQTGKGLLHLLHPDERVCLDRIAILQLAFTVPIELERVPGFVLEFIWGMYEPFAVRTLVG